LIFQGKIWSILHVVALLCLNWWSSSFDNVLKVHKIKLGSCVSHGRTRIGDDDDDDDDDVDDKIGDIPYNLYFSPVNFVLCLYFLVCYLSFEP